MSKIFTFTAVMASIDRIVKGYLSLFLVLLATVGWAQNDTTTKILQGRVFGLGDSTDLTGVHIINLNSLEGTVSGRGGVFNLPVKLHDRILFSHLGYELDTALVTTGLMAGERPLEITLVQTTYLLSIFKVLNIETFEEFERAFMALQLPEDKINLHLPPQNSYGKLPENEAFTIAIPFDLSYFSKKARDLRKYKAVMEQDREKQLIYARYNPIVVETVTGIRNEEEAQKLMDYCDFSDEFVKYSIDYDLYVAIIQCYRSYQDHSSVD